MRKIYLHGDVNEKMFIKLSKKLDKLVAASVEPIEIELNSQGGEAYSGLAIYSKLKSCPNQIRIIAYGAVMSAATVILAAGDIREMAADAWFMCHDSTVEHKGTLASLHQNQIQTSKEEMQWADILARHSSWSVEHWRKASSRTTYLTAHQLKQIKLIHNVIFTKGKI